MSTTMNKSIGSWFRPQTNRGGRGGFTLIEVMVVVAIIVVLVAILVPTIGYARRRAKTAATASFINTISMALESYRADMDQYPRYTSTGNPSITASDCNYAYCILVQALTGFKDATGDGADGPGFRKATGGEGRVYGPYISPTIKNLKTYFTVNDLPNPVTRTSITGNPTNSGYEFHSGGMMRAFLDAWGQPIFYWVGSPMRGAQGQIDKVLFCRTGSDTNNNNPYIFLWSNPDCYNAVTYTVNGQPVQSRLVPYTPASAWDTATTPWGASLEFNGDTGGTANPKPGLKFRAQIGMSNPASLTAKYTDPIVGRSSYLLVSAGPDNQYFTGDEVINEYSK